MKKKILIILICAIGGTTFVVAAFLGFVSLSFYKMEHNLKVGKEFMENLTDENLGYWIKDAKALRNLEVLKARGMNSIDSLDKADRERYSKQGIIRLDVSDKVVSYVWMGGLDHTELSFRFKNDSLEMVIANYNDYTSQKLYPNLENVFFGVEYPKAKNFVGNKNLKSKLE